MARLIGITYAGVTVGLGASSSSYYLLDRYTVSIGYERASVSCTVLVSNANRSTFLTAEAALVAAYRKPDQALVVVLGSGTERHEWDPSENTGFLARATAEKLGGASDTGNSSVWRCSVTVQLPADLDGRAGRRDASVEVQVGANEREVATFSGTYTALDDADAEAQYKAEVDDWVSGITTDWGGTWQRVSRNYRFDDQNKIATFRETHERILLEEGVGTPDVSALVGQQLTVRPRSFSEPRAVGFNALPLQNVSVDYSVTVRSSVTTDLPALYAQTIRPHLMQQIQQTLITQGSLIVVRESPSFDRANNLVGVTIECQIAAGAEFFRIRIRAVDSIDKGRVLLPVWNGDPYARRKYQGIATHVKRVTVQTVKRAGSTERRLGIPEFPGFEEVAEDRDTEQFRLGLEGNSLDLEAIEQTYTFVRAHDPDGGAQTFSERASAAFGL